MYPKDSDLLHEGDEDLELQAMIKELPEGHATPVATNGEVASAEGAGATAALDGGAPSLSIGAATPKLGEVAEIAKVHAGPCLHPLTLIGAPEVVPHLPLDGSRVSWLG